MVTDAKLAEPGPLSEPQPEAIVRTNAHNVELARNERRRSSAGMEVGFLGVMEFVVKCAAEFDRSAIMRFICSVSAGGLQGIDRTPRRHETPRSPAAP